MVCTLQHASCAASRGADHVPLDVGEAGGAAAISNGCAQKTGERLARACAPARASPNCSPTIMRPPNMIGFTQHLRSASDP